MLLKGGFISGVLLTQCIAALHGFSFTKKKVSCKSSKQREASAWIFSTQPAFFCRRRSLLLVPAWAGTHNDALVNPLQSLVGEEVQVWPTSLIF